MKMKIWIVAAVVALVVIIGISSSMYTVAEDQYA